MRVVVKQNRQTSFLARIVISTAALLFSSNNSNNDNDNNGSSSGVSSALLASAQLQDIITYFLVQSEGGGFGEDGDGIAANFSCSSVGSRCVFQEEDFNTEPILNGGGSLKEDDEAGFTSWTVFDPVTDVLTLSGCNNLASGGGGGGACIAACTQDCTCVENTEEAAACEETTRFPTLGPGSVAPSPVPTDDDDNDEPTNDNNKNNDDINFRADETNSTFTCPSASSRCVYQRSDFDAVDARGGQVSRAPNNPDKRVWNVGVDNPVGVLLTLVTCQDEPCIVKCTANCTCTDFEGIPCPLAEETPTGADDGTTMPSLSPSMVELDDGLDDGPPSDFPSMAPSSIGTNNDGSTPSDMPSMTPSLAQTLPSDEPSDQPSGEPSSLLDDTASDMPSSVPTRVSMEPSVSLGPSISNPPSDIPSGMPTGSMSVAPSTNKARPVRGKPVTSTFLNVQMTLAGVFSMDNEALGNWTKTTTNFYLRVYNGQSAGADRHSRMLRHYYRLLQTTTEGISNFSTTITYSNQAVAGVTNTITYAQTVSYIQTVDDDEAPSSWELVQEPFQDPTLNQQYVEDLRDSNEAFESLMDNGVGGPTQINAEPEEPAPKSGDDGGLSTGAIAGIAVGCTVGILLCCCCFVAMFMLLRQQQHQLEGDDPYDNTTSMGVMGGMSESASAPPPPAPPRGDNVDQYAGDEHSGRSHSNNRMRDDKPEERFPEEEEDEFMNFRNNDHSSPGSNSEEDHADYNFDSAFGGAGNSRSVASSPQLFGDEDNDFDPTGGYGWGGGSASNMVDEKTVEVDAPAGPLGVVVDTPDTEGPPLIHDISESSPLVGKLEEGDRLIAVDGQNVSHMTATEVSQLIGSKATNRHRYFTVLRTQFKDGGNNSLV